MQEHLGVDRLGIRYRHRQSQGRRNRLEPINHVHPDAFATTRERTREHQPNRHRLTMGESVFERDLERVRQSVTEVQRGADSGPLMRITSHHIGLDSHAARHDIGEQRGFAIQERRGAGPQQIDEPGRVRSDVEHERVLRHLAESAAVFARLERPEGVRVCNDPDGLVKRADEVLALRQVDRGLAADRRVHHGEQRRRRLHHRHPAVIDGRREPGGVTDHTAAQRDDGITPEQSPLRERATQVFDGAQGLVHLAVAHEEHFGRRVDVRTHRLDVALGDTRLADNGNAPPVGHERADMR